MCVTIWMPDLSEVDTMDVARRTFPVLILDPEYRGCPNADDDCICSLDAPAVAAANGYVWQRNLSLDYMFSRTP